MWNRGDLVGGQGVIKEFFDAEQAQQMSAITYKADDLDLQSKTCCVLGVAQIQGRQAQVCLPNYTLQVFPLLSF